jgi:DNA-binding transcriptional MerR regulator
MPLKEKTIGKLYWSIGEVASELGVNASLIRYWEKEFGTLRPKRTGKGDRLYTRKDIEQLQRIHHLVKEKGYTLQGAKDQLRKGEAATPDRLDEIRDRLVTVREALLELRNGKGSL